MAVIALFMARSLARILENTPVIENCVDPASARPREEGNLQLVYAVLALDDNVNALRSGHLSCMGITGKNDYPIRGLASKNLACFLAARRKFHVVIFVISECRLLPSPPHYSRL